MLLVGLTNQDFVNKNLKDKTSQNNNNLKGFVYSDHYKTSALLFKVQKRCRKCELKSVKN